MHFSCQLQMSTNSSHTPRPVCLQISSTFAKCSGKGPCDGLKRWLQSSVSAWQRGQTEALLTARLSSPPFTWARSWPSVKRSTSSSFLPRALQMLRLTSVQFKSTKAAASSLAKPRYGPTGPRTPPHRNRRSRNWAVKRFWTLRSICVIITVYSITVC